ncbi:probable LRR receptor-like serine/threonine-protein kinase At1g05700 [Cornus florida]|uniref:probable LRR receptor-like serine/threonine-protein kinase At1g05700 n=1 Tax=Cornus florida TaxID=4283 RepID=UPI00289DD3B5|nr:probable LRR receptor-like serine/threonine-protein kinase At1g05700 [Cornus florida]
MQLVGIYTFEVGMYKMKGPVTIMHRMMSISKLFLLAFLGGFPLIVVVHAQVPSGFISIDCGIPKDSNYTDGTTGIYYISDAGFVDTGVSKSVSPEFKTDTLEQQFLYVRSFPEGTRNCYTTRLARGSGNKFLIRARFFYGNYDAPNVLPEFDLHLGVDFWDTVKVDNSSSIIWREITHVPSMDYIHVCLINTGLGTPFISAIEIRPLDNSLYETTLGSLNLIGRWDFGSITNQFVRYKDDVYDRIWKPFNLGNTTAVLSTSSTVDALGSNLFQPPSVVMSTAIMPIDSNETLYFWWKPKNDTDKVYIYMYFAEVEILQPNQSREFDIYINGKLWYAKHVVPSYLSTLTVYSSTAESHSMFNISLTKTDNSTLPPIINAIEIFTVKQLLHLQTIDKEVAAIMSIKSIYGLKRNWQADPCAPEDYVWVGVTCSYDGSDPPRIISLNLSSSGLTGEIAPDMSDLTMIQTLDLSNNNLTGMVPEFLSKLTFLKVLNLSGNNFTGSIPAELLARSKNGSLSLSFNGSGGENTNSCQSVPCKQRKKNKVVVPIVASVVSISLLLTAIVAALWVIKRRKQVVRKVDAETNQTEGSSLVVKNKKFTYSEVSSITNNFQRVIGEGGFGTVYHGYIGDSQVAVKMLSESSIQGYKEFQTEANLLMSVHHKNLTSLVGYCNEGTKLGIIYEYMVNGDLEKHLSGRNSNFLSWEERLQIAVDAALGLEYLHHGCKPPIIHRDVKTTNILLNENFHAKLADFGLSRVIPTEGGTHVSTVVAGTPGYLDPEYYTSNRLTDKSDVYSFGIVLLEIITGRAAIPKGNDSIYIIQFVSSKLANGDVRMIADPRLRGDFDVNSIWKAIELAMGCVSRTSARRPTMNYVVMELKECLAMEMACHETEPKDSIGLIPMNLESGLSPAAR